MERRATLTDARRLFGRRFIGPEEIGSLAPRLGLAPSSTPTVGPSIPFDLGELERAASTHLLIQTGGRMRDGDPITLNRLRNHWGVDPGSEPCFYNQDWYLTEPFARNQALESGWHLLAVDLDEQSRGVDPAQLESRRPANSRFPLAVVAAFAFFAYYAHTGGERLWERSFIWCRDTDHQGDRIYVGRYVDPAGINKNGFNVHRHLTLRDVHGAAFERFPE